ncbi:hypothetical protein [Maribacter thermophilus]|uniref:hypothetical protein n=1 Tax=Maribacter thermophilus TaxID=1197874 RepID=UPI000640ED5C|nr:hypothetical protein [Maribacter thermophilus]
MRILFHLISISFFPNPIHAKVTAMDSNPQLQSLVYYYSAILGFDTLDSSAIKGRFKNGHL